MSKEAKYTVVGGGNTWAQGPVDIAMTLKEAGKLARKMRDGFGATLEWVEVRNNATGNVVLCYRRNVNGDGTNWFKATV